MKKLLDLMASLSNREVMPRRDDFPRREVDGEIARTPASNCAIWNDITRALDLKPGGAK